jgi:hypothetical protein
MDVTKKTLPSRKNWQTDLKSKLKILLEAPYQIISTKKVKFCRPVMQITCFDFFYNFKTFLILRIIQQDVAKNVKTFSCKLPVILVLF